jgi:hypothetical protein
MVVTINKLKFEKNVPVKDACQSLPFHWRISEKIIFVKANIK